MPGSRLKKHPSVDVPVSPQSKPMYSPTSTSTSPEPKPRDSQEPYPVPSNNPASQYTLMEKLGVGSFGTVYKAMHNETKQIVAIKQIGAYACSSGPSSL
jgi:serine/threonine protein kinase